MEIERNDLIISVKSILVRFIGVMVFQLEIGSDLRTAPCWNVELEKEVEENLCEKFSISIDLNKIALLTIDNIVDVINETVVVRETNGDREPEVILNEE